MKKLAALLAAVAVAAVLGFFAGSKAAVHSPHGHQALNEDEEFMGLPRGKVLYVVVDQEGVYLGPTRFDLAEAKTGIVALLKERKIRNLVIYGTDLARYGEVVELYGSIDPSLLRWSRFAFRPLPVGTRKPLTGFLQPVCCYSTDIENKGHDGP